MLLVLLFLCCSCHVCRSLFVCCHLSFVVVVVNFVVGVVVGVAAVVAVILGVAGGMAVVGVDVACLRDRRRLAVDCTVRPAAAVD